MKIYHNARCRKSREILAIITDAGVEPEVVEYLKTPPTAAELKAILKKLGLAPLQVIRKGEKIFKEEYKGKELSDDEWIAVMAANPILIERPIVVAGNKAVLGRPPENVNELLS